MAAAAWRDFYEERAAILQYDAEMSRTEAEQRAHAECVAAGCGHARHTAHEQETIDRLQAIGIPRPKGW